jgi:hypothetical protein
MYARSCWATSPQLAFFVNICRCRLSNEDTVQAETEICSIRFSERSEMETMDDPGFATLTSFLRKNSIWLNHEFLIIIAVGLLISESHLKQQFL